MDYKISEDRLIQLTDNWMEIEFPDALINVRNIPKRKQLIFSNSNGDGTFRYYYGNTELISYRPSGVVNIKRRLGTLFIELMVEEKFVELFQEENLIYLGEWFEMKTGYAVNKII